MTIEKPARITSIDFLRGLIMVVMALDHSRDFLHFDAWTGHDPLDFKYTTAILFLTRWVTHYCAPNFIFLAGLSAYLYGQKPDRNLTKFLFTRGLWLIILEFTIFRFLWTGQYLNNQVTALVIYAIGITMIFFSIWHKLPYRIILLTGALIVLLHNFTDPYTLNPDTILGKGWSLLHVVRPIAIGSLHIYVLYPVLPYFGLICLGYCAGVFYKPDVTPERRQRNLILIGAGAIALFVILRLSNLYGDAQHWERVTWLDSTAKNYLYSALSFVNTTKYPCSLQYILMTVGPALILLAVAESFKGSISQFFITIGKVPMFYYILHLAAFRLIVTVMPSWHNGKHLTTVYFAWASVVLALYMPCRWYSKYKSSHPEKWWLSYL